MGVVTLNRAACLTCEAGCWVLPRSRPLRRCLTGLVVTPPVDGGHLRPHRTQISSQLAPMMDAVIVQERHIKDRREVEGSHKINRSQQLLRRQGGNAIRRAL